MPAKKTTVKGTSEKKLDSKRSGTKSARAKKSDAKKLKAEKLDAIKSVSLKSEIKQRKEEKASEAKSLKVTLVRSFNKSLPNHKLCVKGLGLRRMHHSVVVANNPCTRGLINKINYLVQVEEV